MSNALRLVLPLLHATAAQQQAASARPTLQLVAKPGTQPRLQAAAAQPETNRRKGPHSLRLLQPAEYMPPVRRPALLCGVGFEFYRKYTEALLRRYVKLSMEGGRAPSVLGRELFGADPAEGTVSSFEDTSNFVIDVERCLARLTPGQQHLVRRVALEEYTQQETAAMLGMSLRTVVRRYAAALDVLTQMFVDSKLLQPLTS